MLSKLLNTAFISWLLPPTCVLCGDPADSTLDLCSACAVDLPWITAACQRCAYPLAQESTNSLHCGTCLQSPPPYTRTMSLYAYQPPLNRLITALKFHRKLSYAKLLGELMATQLRTRWYHQQSLPEVIIPVPLHQTRLRERGYNQALELARPAAKQLGIPLDTRSCQRIRATLPQSDVMAHQREHNVQDAFAVAPSFRAKHVAIIDDVITTGHTVSELSRTLQHAGVEKIDVWCVARTPLKNWE